MMKTTLSILLTLLGALAFADDAVVNAGNDHCPVSGKPVDGVTSYTHNGKEYNLCSEGCKVSLAENLEKQTETEVD